MSFEFRNPNVVCMAWLAIVPLAVLPVRPVAAQLADPRFWETDGPVDAVAHKGNTIYIGGRFTTVSLSTGQGVPLDLLSRAAKQPFPTVGGRADAVVEAVAPDGDGGWFIGGRFSLVGGVPHTNLAHILADGQVAAWDPGPLSEVRALAVRGRTVYVGGYFGAMAFDATTGAAQPWNAHPNGSVEALAVKGNWVYVGGGLSSVGGQPRANLAKVDARTGVAADWNPGANRTVTSLAIHHGILYVGGFFTSIGGQPRSCIAALDSETGAVTAWDPEAISNLGYPSFPYVSALAVSGSTVYAGGHFEAIGGKARNGVAAIDATTGEATGWNPDLRVGYFEPYPFVLAMAVSPSTVFMGGSFSTVRPYQENFAAVDLTTGASSGWNVSMYLGITAMAVDANTIYVGGAFRRLEQRRQGLAALDATTGAVTSWDPDIDGRVNALAVTGNTVYVGGAFGAVGGRGQANLSAVDAVTGARVYTGTFYPNPNGEVRTIAVGSGPTLYVGGAFTTCGNQPRNHAAALTGNGYVTAWNPDADAPLDAMAVSGATVYAAGEFTRVGGKPRASIAALDLVGVATPWNPGANGRVATLALAGGRVYAGGDFTTIAGTSRGFVAALDSATAAALPWDPRADLPVSALAVEGGVVYLGGSFRNIGGQPRDRLAAVDVFTAGVTSWNPGTDGRVNALAADAITVYAGGEFSRIGGLGRRGIGAVRGDVVSNPIVGTPVRGEVKSIGLAQNVPDPAQTTTMIQFDLPEEDAVTLTVHDLQGRRVAKLLDRVRVPAGGHQVSIRVDGWPPGVYFYHVVVGRAGLTREMHVIR